MKRKFIIVLLTAISSLSLAFGLSACNDSENGKTSDKWGNAYTYEAAFAEATALGYGGTLQEFIDSISGKDGKDGVGIAKIEIISDNLVITTTDGNVLELGSVKGNQGESAYEIWLKNGHTGTEEDFFAWLRGEDENPQGLDFYLLDDGTYGVAVGKAKFLSNVEIPSSYKGKAVTRIVDQGFSGAYIINAIIPDSVTYIGNAAFSGCSRLSGVTIPKDVLFIGDHAFNNCNNLTSIIIPENVTYIGSYAFKGCCHVNNIDIPDKVTYIGSYAFADCYGLRSVTIPDSVKHIEDDSFFGCIGITSASMPTLAINSIPKNSLQTAIITSGDTIPINAFVDCTSLISIALPDDLAKVFSNAFKNCSSLTSIKIPNYVTDLSNDAFSGCSSLTSITIPDGVTSIETNVFKDCSSLTNVNIHKGVTAIGFGAFYGCSSLKSITLGNGVTRINDYAFAKCSSLESITIPDSVELIDSYAFEDCAYTTCREKTISHNKKKKNCALP